MILIIVDNVRSALVSGILLKVVGSTVTSTVLVGIYHSLSNVIQAKISLTIGW